MKEIIFRGKTSNGKLVYGDLTHKDANVFINGHLVLPDSVSQFVGRDDNGEAMYEGDKVYRPAYCKNTNVEWMDNDCDYIVRMEVKYYLASAHNISESRPHHIYLRKAR